MMGNIEFGLDILSLTCQRHLSGDVEYEIEILSESCHGKFKIPVKFSQ